MASAARTLRLCLRTIGRSPAARVPARPLARVFSNRRPISSTPIRRYPRKDEDEDAEEYEDETGEDGEELELTEEQLALVELMEEEEAATDREYFEGPELVPRKERLRSTNFWLEDESDEDLMVKTDDEEDFSEEDIMSMAHGKLEEHREYREYARIAAWQMPLLSKLARPFEAPSAEQCLRFRYTTYMGESHPAENKVVVEFSPVDLPLTEAQQLKLKKLLGSRWNPETNVAKMSCEQFDHQAQNKRYLGDLVQKLVAEAKDTTDMFEDVPLDTRHHKFKVKPKFPKEWRLTEQRIKFIEDSREKGLLLDQAKEEKGLLVDGKRMAEAAFAIVPPPTSPVLESASRGRLTSEATVPRQSRLRV